MIRIIAILLGITGLLISGCSSADGDERPCLLGNGQCQNFIGSDGNLPTENLGTDNINDSNGENFLCVATPRKGTVNHQEVLALDIEVRGGLPPYNIYKGLTYPIESFSSRTSLLGYYSNTTSASKVVQRTVYLEDASGDQIHCNFTVTVRPQFSDSGLACTLTPDQQVVNTGGLVKFTMEGTGGTAAEYTFSDFSPKSGWTISDSYLQRTAPSSAEVSIVYQTSAVRYPEVIVSNGGESASCRTAVFVGTDTPGGYYPGWDWTYLPPWWGWGGNPYLPPPPGGYIPPFPTGQPLLCDLNAGPNPGLVGTLTEVVASVPSYLGTGDYEVIGYSVSNAYNGSASLVDRLDDHTPNDKMKQILRFRLPGSHIIRATVRDHNTGRTAYCQTYFQSKAPDTYQVGTGHGPAAHVRTYRGLSTSIQHTTSLFGGDTTRANRTAQADVTGDGIVDILVARGPKSGAAHRVEVRDGTNYAQVYDFDPLPSHGGNGGSFIASGDVNGDGHADILVGQEGGPWVKIYDGSSAGTTPTLRRGLRPYGNSYTGGIRVAAGDVNGDGYSDLITIPGKDMDKDVMVYSGKTLFSGTPVVLNTFNPFPKSGGGHYGHGAGGFVAAGDIDGDGYADIVASLDQQESGMATADYTRDVFVYDGQDLTTSSTATLLRQIVDPNGNTLGSTVAVGDIDSDSYGEIVVASARDCYGRIRIYNLYGSPILNFEAYPNHQEHGLFLGAGVGGL